ncbi:MAG: hypothetical protein GY862_21540 [Gammaproteobacteria bacterium]|nr:hypothetical protein [Gammaproteobacteria bacterium]
MIKKRQIIHFQPGAEPEAHYLAFGGPGARMDSVQGELENLPIQDGPLTVLISGVETVLTTARVPARQWQRIVQAVPYSLEEQQAEDVEHLHFALGERNKNGEIAVAVIRHETLRRLLARLRTGSPELLMPDILAIPRPDDGWSILSINGRALVRTGSQAGFAVELANLSCLLSLALREQTPPAQLWILKGTETGVWRTEIEGLGIPLTEKVHEQGAMAWFGQGLEDGPPLNLLQQAYRKADKLLAAWRLWRLTAILVFLWVLLHAGMQAAEFQKLTMEKTVLTKKIENIYRHAFPEARKVVNPRVQMERRLAALQAQQGGGDTNEMEFLRILTWMNVIPEKVPGVFLKRLDYRRERLDLELELPDLEALETLKKLLAAQHVKAEVRSASSQGSRVEGRLRISAESTKSNGQGRLP